MTATNADGQATVHSNLTSTVAATGAPVNTGRPSVTGDAIVGQQLTAENGTWTNAPTSFRYQWVQCDRFGGGVRRRFPARPARPTAFGSRTRPARCVST